MLGCRSVLEDLTGAKFSDSLPRRRVYGRPPLLKYYRTLPEWQLLRTYFELLIG